MEAKTKKVLLYILDLFFNIVIIFGLVIIIQKWLIAPFDVYGASMCDTLNSINGECETEYGEKIIINEASYITNEPERGDIVVFKAQATSDKYFIKRIIGLPGETVEIKDGEIYITKKDQKESQKLTENYLNKLNSGKTKTYFKELSKFEVPEDQYFLLGDNRKDSTDSRSCFEGMVSIDCLKNPETAYVSRKNIRGKTWIVWWPLQNMRIIHHENYDMDTQEN